MPAHLLAVCRQVLTIPLSSRAVVRSAGGLLGFSMYGGAEQGTLPTVAFAEKLTPILAKGSAPLQEGDQLLAVGATLVR